MADTVIRVAKDEVGFLMEVPPGISEVFPLWDPELFAKATVRIGKRAAFPDTWVAVDSLDWLQWEREARERKKALDKKEGR